jgi:outer membrane receptor protein involved in Fe transport
MNSLADFFSNDVSQHKQPPSRKRKLAECLVIATMGASILASQNIEAAPKKKTKKRPQSEQVVSELQAENARLRAQLQQLQGGQGQQGSEAPAAATGTEQPADAAASTESDAVLAKKEEADPKNLGEVVVRNRRTPPKLEKLHDVKQSVSVVSGKELDRELSLDLGAITRRASNVQFNQANTRTASLSIRGVGKKSTSETQDPSVGITVDGISYGLSQLANFSFYDVDQVEVTRGPRGTEGGLAASSGKINITSKAPTFTPTAELSASYGQREALILKGALGGKVIDDLLAWRGSFVVDKGRGFYTNQGDTNYSLYNRDRLSARVQLLFTPTANITSKLSVDYEPSQPQLQNGLTFYHNQPKYFANGTLTDPNGTTAMSKLGGFVNATGVYTGPRAYFQNRGFTLADYLGGEQRNNVWFNSNLGQTVSNKGGSLQTNWDIGSHLLTSVTGFREYAFDAHNDEGTPFDISLDGGGGINYSQYSQELKFANKPGGFIDYKGGLYGIITRDTITSKTGWGSDAGGWFATTAQYNTLDAGAGVNRGSGLALLKDSLQDVRKKGETSVRTTSGAIFGEADLHFTDALSLTTGARVTHEDRSTKDTVGLVNNGVGGALNPVTLGGYQLGGFDSNSSTGALTAANSAQQLQLADSVANRYYGVAITGTAGAAYNSLTAAQKTQIATAKTLRSQQIGQLYNTVKSTYSDVLFTWQVTPSYKFNDDLTGYLSWQYGDKSGAALNVNSISANVKPERTNALELGLKSFWLNKEIIFNIDAFLMDIRNYQQTVQVVDQYTTAINIANNIANPIAYTSAQGNVNKVRVYGVEIDSVFNVIPNFSLRFGGSYNNAKYIGYQNAAKPEELGYLTDPYINQNGSTLAGASKWTFTVGGEYSRPVFDNKFQFHTSFNTNYQSATNALDNLSFYGRVGSRQQTDASIGISTKNNVLDLSFIAKNITNNKNHEQGWNSYGPNPYPLWYGIQLSGKI